MNGKILPKSSHTKEKPPPVPLWYPSLRTLSLCSACTAHTVTCCTKNCTWTLLAWLFYETTHCQIISLTSRVAGNTLAGCPAVLCFRDIICPSWKQRNLADTRCAWPSTSVLRVCGLFLTRYFLVLNLLFRHFRHASAPQM